VPSRKSHAVISNPSDRLRVNSVRDLSEGFLGFASK
jgi:hypothetical protein